MPTDSERASNASFDARPHEYDDRRANGHMARRRVEYYDEAIRSYPGLVVEVGCGTGALLRELAQRHPDREFVGIEPLENYVRFASERAAAAGIANVRFEVGTGETADALLPSASAGLVLTVDSLHHVRDLALVIEALRRVVRPGGRWIAMEPNRLHPYVWLYHVLTPGERTFPARRFRRLARRAGWRVERTQRLFLFPSGVGSVPAWAEAAERSVERLAPLAGGVVTHLVNP